MSTSFMATVKDKARAAMASTDLELAIVKATNRDLAPPKPKHLRALLHACRDPHTKPVTILTYLYHRTLESEWIIVLKALIVLHRISREGAHKIINFLQREKITAQIFRLQDFVDQENLDLSYFIRAYAAYLRTRTQTIRALQWDPTKVVASQINGTASNLADCTTIELCSKMQILQRLLDSLFKCPFRKAKLTNPVVEAAFVQCLQDSVKLFPSINQGVLTILDRFFSMSKSDANESLDIYRKFTMQTDDLIDFYNIAKFLGLSSAVPDLSNIADSSLIDQMETYIADPSSAPKSKPKSQATQTKAKSTSKKSKSKSSKPSVPKSTKSGSGAWDPFGNSTTSSFSNIPETSQTQSQTQSPATGSLFSGGQINNHLAVETFSPGAVFSNAASTQGNQDDDFLVFDEPLTSTTPSQPTGPVSFDPLGDSHFIGKNIDLQSSATSKAGARADQLSQLKQLSLMSSNAHTVANAITGSAPVSFAPAAPQPQSSSHIIDPFANPNAAPQNPPAGAVPFSPFGTPVGFPQPGVFQPFAGQPAGQGGMQPSFGMPAGQGGMMPYPTSPGGFPTAPATFQPPATFPQGGFTPAFANAGFTPGQMSAANATVTHVAPKFRTAQG